MPVARPDSASDAAEKVPAPTLMTRLTLAVAGTMVTAPLAVRDAVELARLTAAALAPVPKARVVHCAA